GKGPVKRFGPAKNINVINHEMEDILDKEQVQQSLDRSIHEVTEVFWDEKNKRMHEHVLEDGSYSDSFKGRLVNPGHGIEAMWFMMEIGRRRDDQELIKKAVDITLHLLHFGWD